MQRGLNLFLVGVATLVVGANLHAGPLVTGTAKNSSYSPWAFRTPILYRWAIERHAPPIVHYTSDHYPFVPATSTIVKYPSPAVIPDAYYADTGLSYDPARPLILGPVEPAVIPGR